MHDMSSQFGMTLAPSWPAYCLPCTVVYTSLDAMNDAIKVRSSWRLDDGAEQLLVDRFSSIEKLRGEE